MTGLPGPEPRRGHYGRGALAQLPGALAELGASRVLLLTGRSSFEASGAGAILPALSAVATVQVWSDFSPNPDVEDLLEGARIAQAFAPDCILAIGGGSVLDMAKLIAALGAGTPAEIRDGVRHNTVAGRETALVLVPTTSGSGSEATHFAVAYIGHEKFSVAHPTLVPDLVILDPSLTESASRYQKATSIIDAIAQAVESRWAVGATDLSKTYADAALTDLVPAAVAFLDGDESAADRAARGSHLAGRAIDISKTTGAHALAYSLTKRHGVSHGHAVATTLGAFARLHAEEAAAAGARPQLADDMAQLAELVGADGIDHVGDRLDALAGDLGLELRLRELGVPQDDVAVMAGDVNHERLGNNPRALGAQEIADLLASCW